MPKKEGPFPQWKNTYDPLLEGYAALAVIKDEKNQPCKYKLLEINRQFESIVGKGRDDAIGKDLKEVLNTTDEGYADVCACLQTAQNGEQPECVLKINSRYFKLSVFSPEKDTLGVLFLEITAQKRAEEALKIHKLLFEAAQDIILYINADGLILDANQKAADKYGYTKQQLLSKTIQEIRHPSTQVDYDYQMMQARVEGVVFESVHTRSDGSVFPVEVSARVAETEKGPLRIHIIRDITKRKENEAQIAWLARYDALTGIQNRGSFIMHLEQEIKRAERNSSRFALMLFDVDKFKHINDRHGHEAGDIVLRHIATEAEKTLRSADQIGRLGGDEFVVLQTDINSDDDVLKLVRRIQSATSAPVMYKDAPLKINLSIGISVFPGDAADVDDLLLCADRAMYIAKRRGGGQHAFFNKPGGEQP